jgi:hypothetical protein
LPQKPFEVSLSKREVHFELTVKRGMWRSSESASAVIVLPTPGGPLLAVLVLGLLVILVYVLHKYIQTKTFSLDEVVKYVGILTTLVLGGQGPNKHLRLGWDLKLIENGLIPADV